MKIEMGESLCCSFLRHVQQCWVVQANWKVSEHWGKLLGEGELEERFRGMRERVDPDESVFKGTKDGGQFLKQGEIDAVGLGQDGSVHAMDVAFHENGLNYLGGADKRVLKKLLRTLCLSWKPTIRRRWNGTYTLRLPRCTKGCRGRWKRYSGCWRRSIPRWDWHLLTNEAFNRELLAPTLEKGGRFRILRSCSCGQRSCWSWGGPRTEGSGRRRSSNARDSTASSGRAAIEEAGSEPGGARFINPRTPSGQLQPLVRGLMRTVLEDPPDLLGETDLRNMMDGELCRGELGLQLGGFPLLRRVEEGRMENGHPRYWSKVYGDEFYVTNNWWQAHHLENSWALARFVEGLVRRRLDHPAVPELEQHRAALERFAG